MEEGSLFSRLRKRNKYEIKVICDNCGFPTPVLIPKGMAVPEFVDNGLCKCDNCGVIIKPGEYKTQWLK